MQTISFLRRDHLLVASALVTIAALSWVYLFRMAAMLHADAAEAAMHAAMGMTMPGMEGSAASEFGALWLMWTVMMAAMMLPSAAPMALLVVGTYRRRGERPAQICSVIFILGYLLVWTLFSGAASGAQVALRHAALLSPEMATTSRMLAASLLVAAGIYQWLPIKKACLAHCRSPLDFLTRYWREGASGALMMGMRHGTFCVGCCWALMALLFVAGVMNLLWVAAIAAFVLVEKQFTTGAWISRGGGLLLVVWGIGVLARGAV